ncbi:energy transducer TonB [Massilia yuzhufengensis]|uniref:Protein TonB n=1 Tax=Massilia yuzhufengensis TaxID=1164594 RepID=A0A1I1JGQ7_9BURK|nr:energy transducer TonB [Massilia yuzhufengensis]SFC47341.1 protein TonB [Massilia yuzhufengensis]
MSRTPSTFDAVPSSPFWKPFIAALGLAAMGASACLHAAPATPAADARQGVDTSTCARPERPADEMGQKHNGTSTWQFLVGADGKVIDAKLQKSSGYRPLDEAARAALVKCRFKPAMLDGQAAQAWTAVQYVWN